MKGWYLTDLRMLRKSLYENMGWLRQAGLYLRRLPHSLSGGLMLFGPRRQASLVDKFVSPCQLCYPSLLGRISE